MNTNAKLKTIHPVLLCLACFFINGCSSFTEESTQSIPPQQVVQPGQVLSGKVIGVMDGETMKILATSNNSNLEFRVRLAEIECPEKYQAYGDKAKIALSDKMAGKDVNLRVVSQDKYGGILAFVYIGQRWINKEMVAEGWAWKGQYSRLAELAEAQRDAWKKKLGLWADENPMSPWEYRNHRMDVPVENRMENRGTIQPLLKVNW